jgi:hypothetical protein
LQGGRDELASSKTREDAAKAAREFVAIGRRTDVRGFILSAAAVGQPLQAVINAFVLSDPRFESWAAEQAQAVEGIELTDKAKASRLRKLDDQIATAEAEAREAAKAAAIAAVEEKFAGEVAAVEQQFSGEAA